MHTILDTCHTLFLDELIYRDHLIIRVLEGIADSTSTMLNIGGKEFEGQQVAPAENSRQFTIAFDLNDLIHFQLSDESFTTANDAELRDTQGFLQIIQHSAYLDFIKQNHGWYNDITQREGQHFRLWTEDEVIDVFAMEKPLIQEIKVVDYDLNIEES